MSSRRNCTTRQKVGNTKGTLEVDSEDKLWEDREGYLKMLKKHLTGEEREPKEEERKETSTVTESNNLAKEAIPFASRPSSLRDVRRVPEFTTVWIRRSFGTTPTSPPGL